MKIKERYILISFIGIFLMSGNINNATAQSVNSKHSVRFLWDNDFINVRGDGTDRYYTNGMRID